MKNGFGLFSDENGNFKYGIFEMDRLLNDANEIQAP